MWWICLHLLPLGEVSLILHHIPPLILLRVHHNFIHRMYTTVTILYSYPTILLLLMRDKRTICTCKLLQCHPHMFSCRTANHMFQILGWTILISRQRCRMVRLTSNRQIHDRHICIICQCPTTTANTYHHLPRCRIISVVLIESFILTTCQV